MAELKTQRTGASVTAFLGTFTDPVVRTQAKQLAAIMRRATGKAPAMWGPAIVGYGATTYAASSGKTTDWFPVGFAVRKAALTLYLMGGVRTHGDVLKRLGRHTVSGGCLHIPDLDAVDQSVLLDLVQRAYAANTTAVPRASAPTPATQRRS